MDSKTKLINFFKEMKPLHKYLIVTVFLVLLTGISLVFMKDDGYTTLYKDLNDGDKTTILNEMQKMGVEYVEQESGEILVKDADLNWVRNELTSMGLPSQSSYNYENFFDSALGTTQSEKDLRELASRKGQLENDVLSNFSNITKVSVQLVLPETESIFSAESKGGSASVLITQKTGSKLTNQQISGLQYMVSTAVPGVKTEDVKIIDSALGIISLTDEEQVQYQNDYEKQLDIVSKAEKETTDSIRNSLSNFFGQENIEINVNMSINFDEIERQIETYGDEGTLRSSQKESEIISKNDGSTTQPEAGVEDGGDVPTYENQENNAVDSYNSETTKDIENFEINKTVENIKKHPELTNTNIVVWLDRTKMREKGIDENTFADSIAIAAGLKILPDGTYENGQVSVMQIDKEVSGNAKNDEALENNEGFMEVVKNNILWIIIGAALLVIGLTILLMVLKRKANKEVLEDVEEFEHAVNTANSTGIANFTASVEEAKAALRQLSPPPADLESMTDEEVLKLMEEKRNELRSAERGAQLQEMLQKEKMQIKEKKMREVEEQIEQLGTEYPKETAEYFRQLLK